MYDLKYKTNLKRHHCGCKCRYREDYALLHILITVTTVDYIYIVFTIINLNKLSI